MSKKLVAYFSASGVTKRIAQNLADILESEIFEIQPEIPYTEADLNWNNSKSRSSIEMNNPSSRPAIANKINNMEEYDEILLGFPIWWYVAPTIINTFLESYDFSGKKIVLFATSGGSGMGRTEDALRCSVSPTTKLITGNILNGKESVKQFANWVK